MMPPLQVSVTLVDRCHSNRCTHFPCSEQQVAAPDPGVRLHLGGRVRLQPEPLQTRAPTSDAPHPAWVQNGGVGIGPRHTWSREWGAETSHEGARRVHPRLDSTQRGDCQVFIFSHSHTHTHTHTHMYTDTHTHTNTHKCLHIKICTHAQAHEPSHTHTPVHMHSSAAVFCNSVEHISAPRARDICIYVKWPRPWQP